MEYSPIEVENEAFVTTVETDGIIRTVVRKKFEIKAEHAIANIQTIADLPVRSAPLLVDMRYMKSISKEARKTFAIGSKDKNVSAVALLSTSHVAAVVANFFIELDQPTLPTRMFSSEKSAINWLKTYL